ncbi:MAG: polyphosphate polymerase domain-containing protein [Clostridia bacterium]|jgi:SPX domain protein involved in polyphosphate accumulation|nr:polyphosphate polymerase domain-containing protein [Clostridia bacterium]MBR3094659.1 polyphosphate polymerase domain-containing protein [Clostridia bacterium]
MSISVMKRHEVKYLLNGEQTRRFREKLQGHMQIDQYGKTSIASLYYDTPTYQLIRSSLEKPAFKEKLRLRSYGLATQESPVFLEMKRKANGVVYKRRVQMTVPLAQQFFSEDGKTQDDGQISREIAAFRSHYQALRPTCLIIYDRTAYFEPGGDLRLTIDENPRYRLDDLTLTKSMQGVSLLDPGWTILEIKVQDAMPLWLTAILSECSIRKGSFSKYGEAYRRELMKAQYCA